MDDGSLHIRSAAPYAVSEEDRAAIAAAIDTD